MKPAQPVRLLLLSACLVWLAACSTLSPQNTERAQRIELFEAKSERVLLHANWSLSGKLSVSDSKDGGSGTLSWSERPESSRMDFYGALGRGAWRLESDHTGARLEMADGESYQAATVEQLIQARVGWALPVSKLAWWVRGLAAPGGSEQQQLDDQGNLLSLVQDGWNIEFTRYKTVNGLELPVRITAWQDDWKVKLAVRKWSLAEAPGADD